MLELILPKINYNERLIWSWYKKLGEGGSYSDPIFDTANIKFYNDPNLINRVHSISAKLLCNEGDLKVLGRKYKTCNEKNCSESGF